MQKSEVIKNIVQKYSFNLKITATKASAQADANLALCKYWGKRDKELNLPTNSSLSINLKGFGTETSLEIIAADNLVFELNGEKLLEADLRYIRLDKYLTNFHYLVKQHFSAQFKTDKLNFKVISHNKVPTEAGLASSSSAFAALVLALNKLFVLNASKQDLSILARLGSGSASRSVFEAEFVQWRKGSNKNGDDSYAYALDEVNYDYWQNLTLAIIPISYEKKSINSTQAMEHTLNTSCLYSSWSAQAEVQIQDLIKAIKSQDFISFGTILEANAMGMHATMLAASPPIFYFLPKSIEVLHKVWDIRNSAAGDAKLATKLENKIFTTADAGPNIKLIFMPQALDRVLKNFPDAEIIYPFK